MASNSQTEHDRPGISNPAYPPRQPPPPPFSPPAYAMHQPPAAQPPFDPFRKKDPFMPSSFADRRDSASLNARETAHLQPFSGVPLPSSSAYYRYYEDSCRADALVAQRPDRQLRDTLQVAPAPPPSPFHSSPLTAFKDAHARRTPVNAPYSRAPLDPPPPPPPAPPPPPSYYNNNNMPPPSTSPKQSPPYHHTRPQSASQSSPPMNGGREGGRSKSRSRAGDSMSISSIMGPEASSAPKGGKMSPPNIHAQPVDARPRTPERGAGGHGSRFAEQPPYPSRIRSHHNTPEDVRQPYHYPHASSQSSPNASTMPPRPYSQPAQPPTANTSIPRENGAAKDEQRALRDRAISDSDKHNAPVYVPYHPIPDQSMYGPIGGVQAADTAPGKRESLYARWTPQEGPPANPLIRDQMQPHYVAEPSPPTKNAADGSDAQARFGRHINGDGPRTPAVNPELRKSIEDTSAHHRSILAIASESARRAERSSPFPQAVKGAQAQPAGLGRDPSIKNEFGRMFAGLGSGIGSTPQPGATVSYLPPGANVDGIDEADAERAGRTAQTTEGHRGFAHTASSLNGRKRRALEDEEKASSESADGEGRITPVSGPVRLGKRAKANPAHHHHHHHHHLHRRPDDPDAPRNSSPFSTFKFPNNQASASVGGSTPSTATTGSAPPHHHHHHHHHHMPVPHHHHPPPRPAFHRPVTTILTQPLLRSVEHLPRHRLGNVLYQCSFTRPPPSAISFSEKPSENVFFTTHPEPLPQSIVHPGVENSTLTVRIPRYYLRREWRELVCRDRRVWGTDVYTDDSDVLAAAIHSGWVAGAFADGVDTTLIDGVGDCTQTSASAAPEDTAVDADSKKKAPATASTNGAAKKPGRGTAASAPPASTSTPKSASAFADPSKALTAPPEPAPSPPPPGYDLHLTLLVLPPLEQYAGSVWHGVRSRSWGANHDGMSFKVERVEWVDGGPLGRWAAGTADKARERRERLRRRAVERAFVDRALSVKTQPRPASGVGVPLPKRRTRAADGAPNAEDEGSARKPQGLPNGTVGKSRKSASGQPDSTRLGLLAELAALVPREALPIGMEDVVPSPSV